MSQTLKAKKIQQPVKKDENGVVLSKEPNKAIQEMMQIIDSLRLVMRDETKVLEGTDTDGFMALQDRKLEVARDYQSGMAQMLARKDEIKAADPTLKARLEHMRGNFAEIAQSNLNALDQMSRGTKALGERIMRAARKTAEREQQFVYGSSGRLQSGSKASMGINESA